MWTDGQSYAYRNLGKNEIVFKKKKMFEVGDVLNEVSMHELIEDKHA